MTFEYSDAWLLEAVKFSENGDNGATLTDIIQAADYISHAIMTNTEFANGTRKLKSIGLITEKDKRLQTTDKFNEWWTNRYGQKSRISALKAMEEIKTYLNRSFGTIEDPTTDTDTEITDTDLDKATKEYLDMASSTLDNLTKRGREKGE